MNSETPAEMTVIEIRDPGGPEALVPATRPVPRIEADDILIRVGAAGVNRPDVMQRMGLYPPPKGASDLPGLEVAGEVAACGSGVARWSVGDRVTALVPGGGYAQYCKTPASSALPIPAGMDLVTAAGLPETHFTVWSNVFDRGGLKSGEVFLVHGGTSGIGVAAIQFAARFGATVIATAGSDEKCAVCTDLGAHYAINYLTTDFVDAVKEATDGHGADLILDMVGGDYVERNYSAAAMEGRIVQIAFLNGAAADVNFSRLLMKRLVHTGSTLRPRDADFKAAIARNLEEKVWPLYASGAIRAVTDSTFPLVEAARAHERIEAADHVGKIILIVDAGLAE